MVFYIWQSGGMVDQVVELLMVVVCCDIYCWFMLDFVGSVVFFCSFWVVMMCNVGIEVVEVLKVNLMCVFLCCMDFCQYCKMVMIDNYIVYIGSMNMVDLCFFKQDVGVG